MNKKLKKYSNLVKVPRTLSSKQESFLIRLLGEVPEYITKELYKEFRKISKPKRIKEVDEEVL